MKPHELAESFMEQHGRTVPLPELKSLFESTLQRLGIRYYACSQHVDPLTVRGAALVFHNYPQSWMRYLSESGRYRMDPVCRFAEERLIPFRWNDPGFRASLTSAQREMLTLAATHGIMNGYTVPIHVPGTQTGSCSVVPNIGAIIDGGIAQAVFSMAYFMFDAMLRESPECTGARSMQLSERERQCLELAAQGKDDWAIGSLLRISERTAHNHIERAKRRLGVCTRVQVIVQALNDGQISFGDVIKERELRKKAN